MLTLIQPCSRKKYQALLTQIFATRAGFYESHKDPYDTSKTLYMAYQKTKLGIFASARLNLLSDSLAAPFYQKHFSAERQKKGCELSLISFQMEDHWAKDHTPIFDIMIRDFHQSLLHLVSDICRSQGFQEIMTLSFKDDHPDLAALGGWCFQRTHNFTTDSSLYTIGELPLTLSAKDASSKEPLSEEVNFSS